MPDISDLDEFVGYHLERAYLLRAELGESDRRTVRLAEDGGRRLGAAGVRALKRGDVRATTSLLGRATSLLPRDEPLRRELLCELGIGLRTSGDSAAAESTLEEAIASSQAAHDRRIELRGRIEYEYVRFLQESTRTGDALLDATTEGIPIFESVKDNRSLARAWLLAGFVLGAHRGQHKAGGEAAERAYAYYKSSHWPTATCLGQIAIALYYGPTSVPEAVTRCSELLDDAVSDRVGGANVQVFLGGLMAQRGNFDEARELVASAKATYEDLGQRTSVAIYCEAMLGEIELLADDAVAAELILRELCAELERTRALSHLASRAGDLAEALYSQGHLEDAEEWTLVGARHTAPDDLDAQLAWMPVRAKIAACRGVFEEAEAFVRNAVGLSEQSDALNRRASVQCDLGEVLRLMGRASDAASAFTRATELYEQKGNVVCAAKARVRHEDMALV